MIKKILPMLSLLTLSSLAACGNATIVDPAGGGHASDPMIGQPAPLPEITVDLKMKVVPGPAIEFTAQYPMQNLGTLTMSTAQPRRGDLLYVCAEGTGPLKVVLLENTNANRPKSYGEVVVGQSGACAWMQTNRIDQTSDHDFAPITVGSQPTTYVVSAELLDLHQRNSRLTVKITDGTFSDQNGQQYAAKWSDPLGRTNEISSIFIVR